jgi:hypothetical protein
MDVGGGGGGGGTVTVTFTVACFDAAGGALAVRVSAADAGAVAPKYPTDTVCDAPCASGIDAGVVHGVIAAVQPLTEKLMESDPVVLVELFTTRYDALPDVPCTALDVAGFGVTLMA